MIPFLEFSRLDNQPYWQRQQEDAIYKIYENNSDFFRSDDIPTTWVTNDDLLSKCEAPADMPNLCEISNQNTTTGDDALIELSQQLTDSKLSQSGINSTYSYRTSRASTIATRTAQQNEPDSKEPTVDIREPTISGVPLKDRLAVAQQKMNEHLKMTEMKTARCAETEKKILRMTFPAGFIVDNKAIEDKYKEHHENDTKRNELTKRNQSRFDKAKEVEEW